MFLNEFATQANMKPARVVVALAVLFSLFGLQVWQTLKLRDDWPLSSYPMYSGLQSSTATRQALVAVTEHGEVPLDPEYTRPLGGARLQQLLRRRGPEVAPELAKTVCGNLKRLGKPVELSAIRLYQVSWEMRADLTGIGGERTLTGSFPVDCAEQAAALVTEGEGSAPPARALETAPGPQ
jgi:hypothetical protein